MKTIYVFLSCMFFAFNPLVYAFSKSPSPSIESNLFNSIGKIDQNFYTIPIEKSLIPFSSFFSGDLSAIGGGYDEMILGGVGSIANISSPYGPSYAQSGHLLIAGDNSGPYNAGMTLGISNESIKLPKMPISGDDYRGGFVSTHDGVELEQFVAGAMPRMILPVTSYKSNSVSLQRPMTTLEAAQIHSGMYIVSNSVPAKAKQVQFGDVSLKGLLPSFQNYSGIISGISDDKTIIYVYGWAKEQSSSGDIPNILNLDTVWDNRKYPVVYVGASNKVFAQNAYINYDGRRTGLHQAESSSLIHQFEWNEIDELVSNTNNNYDVSMHGATFTTNAASPRTLTKDSYHIMLAGGQQNFIKMAPQWWTVPINSDEIFVNSPQGPALAAGSHRTIVSFGQSTNTGDNTWNKFHTLRAMIWNTRNNSDVDGSDLNITTNFGIAVDGTANEPNSIQEHIEFNPKSNNTGISLCNYNQSDESCSFVLDGNGVARFRHGAVFNDAVNVSRGGWLNFADRYGNEAGWIQAAPREDVSGRTVSNEIDINFSNREKAIVKIEGSVAARGYIQGGSYTLRMLPTVNIPDGASIWCSDCKLNGVRGVIAYYHISERKWLNALNGLLVR